MERLTWILSLGLIPAIHAATNNDYDLEDDIIGMAVGATMAFVFLVLLVTLIFLGLVWQKWFRQIQFRKGRLKITREQWRREREAKKAKKREAAAAAAAGPVPITQDTAKYVYFNGNVAASNGVIPTPVRSGMEIQEKTLTVEDDDDDDAIVEIKTYQKYDHQDELVTTRGFAVLDDVPIGNSSGNDDAVVEFGR